MEDNQYDFVQVIEASEVAPGERIVMEIDGEPVALFNVDGAFYAIGDVCTHDGGPLAEGDLNGFVIACPRHGATFDIRTGQVLSMPATRDTTAHQVKVEADSVWVKLNER